MDELVPIGSLGASSTDVFQIDPVCRMRVMPETAAAKYEYKGTTYYFCNPRCLERFRAAPEQFLAPAKSHTRIPDSGISRTYTCPMHPEVRQSKPGVCPKCGMALEAETVTLDEEGNPELADMGRRFAIGAAFSLPVLVLGM